MTIKSLLRLELKIVDFRPLNKSKQRLASNLAAEEIKALKKLSSEKILYRKQR